MHVRKWIAAGLLLVLATAGGAGWWQRARLEAWWLMRGLGQAGDDEVATRGERLASLGEVGLSALCAALTGDDPASRNALAALDHLARRHGPADLATANLAVRLTAAFPRMGPQMQAQALRDLAGWFGPATPAEGLVSAAGRLVEETAARNEPPLHAAGLELAAVLVRQPGGLAAAREMARAGLRSPDAEVRLRAVQLSLQPGVEMLEQVVGLLRDPNVTVRRAAILAVGPAEQVAGEDVLLPGLHDADPEVRRHTEAALRSRGLRPEHLELGRLLTDPRAATRLRVLDRIREMLDGGQGSEVDLDPGVWLRRLSHDGSPAVRAAALRLMSQQSLVDLSDRIAQMARNDPSPTVSQLARFYLRSERRSK